MKPSPDYDRDTVNQRASPGEVYRFEMTSDGCMTIHWNEQAPFSAIFNVLTQSLTPYTRDAPNPQRNTGLSTCVHQALTTLVAFVRLECKYIRSVIYASKLPQSMHVLVCPEPAQGTILSRHQSTESSPSNKSEALEHL